MARPLLPLIYTLALAVPLACTTESDGEAVETSASSGAAVNETENGDGTTDGTTDATTDATTDGSSSGSTGGEPPANGSPGCGADPTGVAASIDIDGTARTFLLALPNGYDANTPYPLVFAWHGRGGDGALARLYYKVEEASNGQAIIVYPNGLDVPQAGGTGWVLSNNSRDLRYYDALLADLSDNLCVDSSRVFSTGHSFGAYMSNAVGCFRGDSIRAIGAVAGGGPLGACVGQTAAWIAHGTEDPTVPYSEGESARDYWVGGNSCGAQTDAVAPDNCQAYQGCDTDYPVTWCSHSEVGFLNGHDWPAWAGPAIWEFFAQF